MRNWHGPVFVGRRMRMGGSSRGEANWTTFQARSQWRQMPAATLS